MMKFYIYLQLDKLIVIYVTIKWPEFLSTIEDIKTDTKLIIVLTMLPTAAVSFCLYTVYYSEFSIVNGVKSHFIYQFR